MTNWLQSYGMIKHASLVSTMNKLRGQEIHYFSTGIARDRYLAKHKTIMEST